MLARQSVEHLSGRDVHGDAHIGFKNLVGFKNLKARDNVSIQSHGR